jgi:hypothetical protein
MTTDTETALTRLKRMWTGTLRVLGYAVCDVLSAMALGVRVSLERLAAMERLNSWRG